MALIDAKCLVFPQQRGFDWCEVPSFAQQRGFDWYEVPSFSPAMRFWLVRSKVLCFAQQRSYFIWNWHRVIFYSCATLDLLTACLFKEIDAQICLYIVYKSVLSVLTQEFSLVVWLLMCDRKTNPKKLVSADIFRSFGPTKKKIRSSAVCLRNFVIKSAYVQPSALFESSSVFPTAHSSFLVSAFLVSTQLL